MIGFIICLLIVLAVAILACLCVKLSGISDWINGLDLSESEIISISNRELQELENTEYNLGHNIRCYHDEQE